MLDQDFASSTNDVWFHQQKPPETLRNIAEDFGGQHDVWFQQQKTPETLMNIAEDFGGCYDVQFFC